MRRALHRLLPLAFVAMFIVACSDGDVAGPEDPGPEDPTPSTLSGRIVNRSTGDAVPGATVSLDDEVTTAGADGRFTFVDLLPGPHALHASAAGFEDLEQDVILPTNFILSFALTRKEVVEFGDFAIYAPARVSKVRGVLVALGGPDTRAFATGGAFGAPVPEVETSLQTLGARFRAMAVDEDLAIVGTSLSGLEAGVASDELLLGALAEAAAVSGRPDLATAPLLLYGMAAGAPAASGLVARHPERSIGLFLKVPAGIEPPSEAAARAIPAFVALAGDDAFVDNAAIVDQFTAIRSGGAPWALATERAVPHHSLSARHLELTMYWMRDILRLRLTEQPGRLVAIDQTVGYLGSDPSSDEIDEWGQYTGDPLSASWLPSWEMVGRWYDFGAAAGPESSSFRLSRRALSVREEWTTWLNAYIRDKTGAAVWDPSVTFSSNRDDVATVRTSNCNWYCDGGVAEILGVSEGEAVITVTYGSDTAQSTITVLPAVTLQVEPSTATIGVGETIELTVRVVETATGAVVATPEFAIDWSCNCWDASAFLTFGSASVDEAGTHLQVKGKAPGWETVYFYPRGVYEVSETSVIQVQ